MKKVTASYLRKEFPEHHDTKFRLLVYKKGSTDVLCDELFDSYEDADKRTSDLFCYRDGESPKYNSADYIANIYYPLAAYEDGEIVLD